MTSRYAIYYAPPPETELWAFGSAILGYDAASGADVAFADIPAAGPDWRALTEEPRRYGFHATLKAPFALCAAASQDELVAAATAFATARHAVPAPRLHVVAIGGFVALAPAEAAPQVDELAAACVTAFDPFRAPLTSEDRDRRLRANLSARQVRHFDRWGYPHVFQDFRFHMTLTGNLPDALRDAVRTDLDARYRRLDPETRIDAIAVFRQEDHAGRFRILARCPFGA